MTRGEPDSRTGPPGPIEPRGVRLASALGLRDVGRLLGDFATYLPSQAIPAIAGFLVLPVLARELAPTALGVLAIAQTLVTLGWTIVGTWLAATIIRELPSYADGRRAAFAATLARGLVVSGLALAAFGVALAAGAIVSSAIAQNLLLIVAATAGLFVQNIAVSLFAAQLRPRAYAAVEVSARVGGIGVGVALVFTGHGVAGYLAGLAASSIVIGIVGLAFAWPRQEQPQDIPVQDDPDALRRWLAYGVPASLGGIVLWGLSFVDRYLLAVLENAAAVGVYTVGNVLGDRIVMVPMFAFTAAATPLLVTAFEADGRASVERLMSSYTRVILLVGFPCVAYIAAVGGDLVTLITGYRYAEYEPAATVAPIVAVGSIFTALAGLAHTGLAVARRTIFLVLAASIGLAANVLANLALIPPYGIVGAAVATPIGTAVYLAATYWWARAYATWRFPFATLFRSGAAAAAGYVAVSVAPLGGPRVLHVVLAALVGAVVYVAALAILGERRRNAAALA